MQLCIRRAKLPRKTFLSRFPGNETNLEWLDTLISENPAPGSCP